MKKLADELWDKKTLPPGWLGRRTPHEFAAMFFRDAAEESELAASAALALIAKENHDRARTRRLPLIPPSLLARLDPRHGPAPAADPPPPSVAPLGGMMMAGKAPPIRL